MGKYDKVVDCLLKFEYWLITVDNSSMPRYTFESVKEAQNWLIQSFFSEVQLNMVVATLLPWLLIVFWHF